jgi:DNA-binding transcriptional MerR regulator
MTAAAEAVPPPDGATPPGQLNPSLMSIGEVLAELRVDFPDVTISKLRFLEAEGLVEPQRTAAGYRKYAVTDVARLRFVLAAQRDRFLPLRVIRDQLAALDRGEPAPAVTVAALAPSSGSLAGLAQRRPPLSPIAEASTFGTEWPRPDPEDPEDRVGEVRLNRAQLLRRSGLTEDTLRALEEVGLVICPTPGWFDADALVIARVAAQLGQYGLGPRHLRAFRAAADREVGLFTQLIAPMARSSTPAAHARAAETLRELTTLSEQLHAALVRIGLRETLGQ